MQQETAVKKALKKDKVNVMTRWGSTIYHYEDMEKPPEDTAHIYGNFVRQSQGTEIRPVVESPREG